TGGSITLTPAQLAGLALVSDGETQHFDLTVTATVVDGQTPGVPLDPLQTAFVTKTLHVDVTPVADVPKLGVPDAVFGESDNAIPISISTPVVTETNDPDAFVTSLTISGIPSDATLTNSSGALSFSNGSITFTGEQLAAGALNGLAIKPTSADGTGGAPGID